MANLYSLFSKMITRINESVKTVNGTGPDVNGNVSITVADTDGVKTINGNAPDDDGNINIKAENLEGLSELAKTGSYENIVDLPELAEYVIGTIDNANGVSF